MERSVTDELTELLEKKNLDFMTLSRLNEAPKSLRDRLKLKSKASGAQIEKALAPHLGNVLAIKKGSRYKYLTFKQPDEVLLFRIVQKAGGKKAAANNIPFNKSEYVVVMNRLLERGAVSVKLGKNFEPLLFAAENKFEPNIEPNQVSEEAFRSAFVALERGDVFVDIFALRRRLGWPTEDFDAMLRTLRDAGKIQLHVADATILSAGELADSFVDENRFKMGSVTWRQGGRE